MVRVRVDPVRARFVYRPSHNLARQAGAGWNVSARLWTGEVRALITMQLSALVLAVIRRQPRMHLRNHCGSFAYRCRDAFGRTCAHIADSEHARHACFERKRMAVFRHLR